MSKTPESKRARIKNGVSFLVEAVRNRHSTGAIAPSGRFLARALASQIHRSSSSPCRLLEVGGGTGAITARIIERMQDNDRLWIFELNPTFAKILEEKFGDDPRVKIHPASIETIGRERPFDHIVSSLPFNNFEPQFVEQIFDIFRQVSAPETTMSFFEYLALPRLKGALSPPRERKRIESVTRILKSMTSIHEFSRTRVLANVPPAVVHHTCLRGDPAPLR